MREYWANVYASPAGTGQMQTMRHKTPDRCDEVGNRVYDRRDSFYRAYRIHVRLKPEGAPKRYVSEANRRAWERAPLLCRSAVMDGYDGRDIV